VLVARDERGRGQALAVGGPGQVALPHDGPQVQLVPRGRVVVVAAAARLHIATKELP
jgi:hypothetical protein